MTAVKAPSAYVSGWCGSGRHDRCLGVYAGVDCSCPHHTEPTEVVVHCFFHCGHVVRSVDPMDAHDGMEQHYRDAHWSDIRRAIGWLS